ncbi:hypothetical protein [Citricoccus sp.]|uniref:hypothetical protein n=1 Tax=Citricoccus sp. TaxID=1978372 RepID=UPI002629EACE|nr:hypothetical protein [Citricoccus sp.]HRO93986.1 hypothetical protein [Citricoccus sp.]
MATLADTGTGSQLHPAIGFRIGFDVDGAARIPAGAAAAAPGETTVVLNQDAEDFHQVMGHFMDPLDSFYQVLDEATEVVHAADGPLLVGWER